MSAALKARGHRPPVNEWSVEEDAELVGYDSNATIARRLGRSLGAVQTRRVTLKIPTILPVDAAAIRQRRTGVGWTRGELANHAEMSPIMVWKLETGSCRGMARDGIARIAAALGCRVEDLLVSD